MTTEVNIFAYTYNNHVDVKYIYIIRVHKNLFFIPLINTGDKSHKSNYNEKFRRKNEQAKWTFRMNLRVERLGIYFTNSWKIKLEEIHHLKKKKTLKRPITKFNIKHFDEDIKYKDYIYSYYYSTGPYDWSLKAAYDRCRKTKSYYSKPTLVTSGQYK